jgi:hypothetical protein
VANIFFEKDDHFDILTNMRDYVDYEKKKKEEKPEADQNDLSDYAE